MVSISSPTNMEIDGPWLLDSENLKDLDDVLDSCFARASEHRNQLIDTAIAEKLESQGKGSVEEIRSEIAESYEFRSTFRKTLVYLPRGRTANATRFQELSSLPNVHEETPRGFDAVIRVASTEVKVGLSTWNRQLSIGVSSDDKQLSEELFGKLQNWATDIQPKRWLQKWLDWGPMWGRFSCFVWLFASIMTFAVLAAPREAPSQTAQQARQIAEQGVTPSNQAKAIGLLLALETGYEPISTPPIRHYPGKQYWLIVCLSLAVLLAISFPPKGGISLWKGRQSVFRQRNWIRFVSVSIPLFILMDILSPWLLHSVGFPS